MVEPEGRHDHTIIWMHGLGADGYDFIPVVKALNITDQYAARFVLPNAPQRPVSVNGGLRMPAWYDIIEPDLSLQTDFTGVADSVDRIVGLVEQELQRGVAAEHIVLAGFSQGGVIALHSALRLDRRIGGVIALSTYLPLQNTLALSEPFAVFWGHGTQDPVVPYSAGLAAVKQLEAAGCEVGHHAYSMPHAVCDPEINDIRNWLLSRPGFADE